MEWVACVGVDWADRKHAYAVRGADGSEEAGEFLSRPEEVHEWARGLRDRYPTGTIVVALEQSRGALLYALSGYEYLRLVPINPRASKAYRSSLRLSGAKDDPSDAVLLRDFAAAHLDELRVWTPDDVSTRKLRLLVESRRSLVDQRTAFTLGLNEVLKQYYPQILEWFGRGASTLAREFVLRWTTLEQARGARADAIRRLVQQLTRRSPEKIDELIVKIRTAVALTTDPAILEAHALRARSLIALIAESDRQVSLFDAEIAELWSTHADRKIFESFPGAGPVMAPRLSAAFGSDRNRFADAIQIQNYSGSLRSRREAASTAGFTHDGSVPSSCARASTSLPSSPSLTRVGLGRSTLSSGTEEPVIMRQFARSLFGGFASCSSAGAPIRPTMNPVISTP